MIQKVKSHTRKRKGKGNTVIRKHFRVLTKRTSLPVIESIDPYNEYFKNQVVRRMTYELKH